MPHANTVTSLSLMTSAEAMAAFCPPNLSLCSPSEKSSTILVALVASEGGGGTAPVAALQASVNSSLCGGNIVTGGAPINACQFSFFALQMTF